MYEIKVDQAHAIVEYVLQGLVNLDEMDHFVQELNGFCTPTVCGKVPGALKR